MKKQFDRPEAPLVVAPVTVVGDYAVAGWTQTGKAGRALLQKDKLKLFASFEGMVKIDAAAGHGAHGAPSAHSAPAAHGAVNAHGKQ